MVESELLVVGGEALIPSLGALAHAPTSSAPSDGNIVIFAQLSVVAAQLFIDVARIRPPTIRPALTFATRLLDFDLIDKEAALWTIPARKMKVPSNGDHVVPLSKAALHILERIERLGRRSAGAVFKGVYGRALSDGVFRKIIQTINKEREEKGEKPFVDAESGKTITQHGTARATFRTWAGDNGQDRDAVEKALHHVADAKLGKSYDRSNALEARRKIAERWASHCLSKCPADWYEIKGA